MSVITKVADYDVFGFRDLINPPNLPEPERLRPFTAKLFFLDIRDGSQGEIIPKLLRGHAPPKTSVLPYEADGHYCVVIYEGYGREERDPSHIPALLNEAKAYCEKNRRDRKVFSAQDFLDEFPEQFKRVVKDTLAIELARG
jgi:hypothetical protein